MRIQNSSKLAFIAVATLAALTQATPFLKDTIQGDPSVPFNAELSCGACVVGGYRFCWKGDTRVCCKSDDLVCLNAPGAKCSDDSAYPDLFSKLYQFCNKGTLRNDVVCSGQTMINF